LTPIWTAGIDPITDRLHETSLIGSLRWWYEALIRGLGGYVCDPTEQGCKYDPKEQNEGLCDACRLFGATGWGRKFRIVASGKTESLLDSKTNVRLPSGHRQQGGWYIFSSSQIGTLQLNLHTFREIRKEEAAGLRVILALLTQYGALSAKTSNGYGVVTQYEIQENLINEFQARPISRKNHLPDLRDFFFAKLSFDEPKNPDWWIKIQGIEEAMTKKKDAALIDQVYGHNIIPLASAIRNGLRYEWLNKPNSFEDYYIFGKAGPVCPNCFDPVKPDNRNSRNFYCFRCGSIQKGKEEPSMASKINVSYAYPRENGKWEFRIWGWMPCSGGIENRNAFLNDLKSELENPRIWKYVFDDSNIKPILEWHSQDCKNESLTAYLQELLVHNDGGSHEL
jgi:CRISPR-associated protein Cmr1